MPFEDWASPDEIVREFGLTSPPNDLEKIKDELKAKLAELHPDRSGGQFAIASDKERYLRLNKAIGFVELHAQSAGTLVRVSEIPAIVTAVQQALAPSKESQTVRARAEFLADFRQDITKHYAVPKVTSGFLAAICGAIFTFIGQLRDHPLLGWLAESAVFQQVILTSFLISGLFFVILWIRERRHDAEAEYLMSEKGLRESFRWFYERSRWSSSFQPGEQDVLRFTKRSYSEFLQDWPKAQFGFALFTRFRLSPILAERLAELHLEKLLTRRVIRKHERLDVDQWFELDKDLAERIAGHF